MASIRGVVYLKNIPILYGDAVVGEGSVTETGLYYQIQCKCRFADSKVRRIILSCENGAFDIGICVPENGYFISRKRIPKKAIDLIQPRLFAEQNSKGVLISVDNNNPFPFLEQLEHVRLVINGDVTYIQPTVM